MLLLASDGRLFAAQCTLECWRGDADAVHLADAGPPPRRSPTHRPPSAPDIRFGAVEAYQAPTRATQAGVRWERIPFNWSTIQPTSALDWVDPYTSRFFSDEASRGRAVAGMIMPRLPGLPPPNSLKGAVAVPAGLILPTTVRRTSGALSSHVWPCATKDRSRPGSSGMSQIVTRRLFSIRGQEVSPTTTCCSKLLIKPLKQLIPMPRWSSVA